MKDIKSIKNILENSFSKLVDQIGNFNVVDESLLPFGLKAHTRSISWIAEQVILQQAKIKAKELGFRDVEFCESDTDVFDCTIIDTGGDKIYVNIKVTNIEGRHNKNDISAAERLYNFFINKTDGPLFYVVIGIKFENTKVILSKDHVYVFSPVSLSDIYVNPKNAKLQAYYDGPSVERTIPEFLDLLHSASLKKKIRFLKRH